MKKDIRNVPYPIYPGYQYGGMMPTMPITPPYMMNNNSSNTCQNDNKSLMDEIESLKRRVSYLENNLLNNYNSSNYQVM